MEITFSQWQLADAPHGLKVKNTQKTYIKVCGCVSVSPPESSQIYSVKDYAQFACMDYTNTYSYGPAFKMAARRESPTLMAVDDAAL